MTKTVIHTVYVISWNNIKYAYSEVSLLTLNERNSIKLSFTNLKIKYFKRYPGYPNKLTGYPNNLGYPDNILDIRILSE
jgi:hypothetical protein